MKVGDTVVYKGGAPWERSDSGFRAGQTLTIRMIGMLIPEWGCRSLYFKEAEYDVGYHEGYFCFVDEYRPESSRISELFEEKVKSLR